MSTEITPIERRKIAAALGISDPYLYQCLTGRRDMDAAEARRLEARSRGKLKRWHLRRDWYAIWPELVGKKGAPAVPEQATA